MLPTILSKLDLRRFDSQIADETVGIDGQEKLRYSKVVVNGLGGIGIAAMRCLLSAGIGKVIVTDSSIITEKMLPTQTLFGMDDVGKLRCIAAREKQIGGELDNSLKLFPIRLDTNNAEKVIGNAKIIIKTTWGPDFHCRALDFVDEDDDRCVIGAFANGWTGVFGTYYKNNKEQFRELYTNLYLRNPNSFSDDPLCFSFVSNFIGSILAGKAIKILLGLENSKKSDFYKIDMLTLALEKLL